MEYDEARSLLTTLVDAHVSEVEPEAGATLESLISESALHLTEQPERLHEARANFEKLLRTSTDGPYDSPQATPLTVDGLSEALRHICPPPVFPICPDH